MIRRRITLFIPLVAAAATIFVAVPANAEDDAQLELVRQKVDEMFDMIAFADKLRPVQLIFHSLNQQSDQITI